MTEQYSKFENYKPPFPFNRPYSATILSKFRKAVRLRMLQTIEQYHSKQIIEVDDYKLVAHFHIKESNNKNIYLLPGYLGGHNSTYMLNSLEYFFNRNWNVIRLNPVDHGDSLKLNKKFFHALHDQIVANALEQIIDPTKDCFLAGFSFGGNFALRIGTSNFASKFKHIAGISPMIDHETSIRELPDFFIRYYNNKWKHTFRVKEKIWSDYNFSDFYKMNDFFEMIKLFLPIILPDMKFDDIKDFFRMYEINEAVIQNLKTKASIIIAEDDPVVPFHTTKHLSDNSHVNFLSTKYGGHNGFVENFKLEDFSIKILEEEFSKKT